MVKKNASPRSSDVGAGDVPARGARSAGCRSRRRSTSARARRRRAPRVAGDASSHVQISVNSSRITRRSFVARRTVAFRVVSVIVQKYGGTSVAGPEEIKRVARRVVDDRRRRQPGLRRRLGDGRHDRPADRARRGRSRTTRTRASRTCCSRPASGSRSRSLSMAIIDLGRDAVSFTGSQAGIVTDTSHGKARIVEMRRGRVHEALEPGKIAIVAGFQGVSTDRDVTTLGRGGSDTTAVALAAALDADVCEIYTDVDGVFTADPRIVPGRPQARARSRTRRCSSCRPSGARVLMLRSVEYARNHGVRLHVRSSFTPRRAPGSSRRKTCSSRRSSRASRTTRPRRR